MLDTCCVFASDFIFICLYISVSGQPSSPYTLLYLTPADHTRDTFCSNPQDIVKEPDNGPTQTPSELSIIFLRERRRAGSADQRPN